MIPARRSYRLLPPPAANSRRVPALTLIPPVNVLLPLIVKTAPPVLVTDPSPLIDWVYEPSLVWLKVTLAPPATEMFGQAGGIALERAAANRRWTGEGVVAGQVQGPGPVLVRPKEPPPVPS